MACSSRRILGQRCEDVLTDFLPANIQNRWQRGRFPVPCAGHARGNEEFWEVTSRLPSYRSIFVHGLDASASGNTSREGATAERSAPPRRICVIKRVRSTNAAAGRVVSLVRDTGGDDDTSIICRIVQSFSI